MDQTNTTFEMPNGEKKEVCCDHQFEFTDIVSSPTCLRTHEITPCFRCKGDHSVLVTKAVVKYFKMAENNTPNDVPFCHFHVWREDGSCGSVLNFPDQPNGENFGFDKTKIGFVSNSNRKCNAKRGE